MTSSFVALPGRPARFVASAAGLLTPFLLSAIGLLAQVPQPAAPIKLTQAQRDEARSVLKELIETNTSHSVGSTGATANEMRQRLLDAGFPARDLAVLGPDERHNNLVARYRGKPGSTKKPMLVIAHMDVVEARREDWTTDPFKLVEKDGYFYGRGTQDIKEGDAIWVLALMRLKREGFVPDRDVILALTADEEGGTENGVDWLLKHHREMIDAGFALNPDAGGVATEDGKPLYLGVEATEKLYADFKLTTTNPGGHSSVPPKDNAIYEMAEDLLRLSRYTFPTELNGVTRAYFKEMATLAPPDMRGAMAGVLETPPAPAAVARLSQDPFFNSELRTTCVATMESAGHAPNALPGRAETNVNCRIFPGHTPGEIRKQLAQVIGDPKLTIDFVTDSGINAGENEVSVTPPPLNPEVFGTLRTVAAAFFPGIPVVPEMETGASDSKITMEAGIPSYGFSGIAIDENDDRAHGKDERLRVESYYTGVAFTYVYLKEMTTK